MTAEVHDIRLARMERDNRALASFLMLALMACAILTVALYIKVRDANGTA